MCGITGVFNPEGLSDSAAENSAVALQALIHRGPDHQGQYNSLHCCLSHARLAIIDPDPVSNQPLKSEDHPGILVFNGEIFNYRELRSDLEKKGIRFRTQSDTEVVLNGLNSEGLSYLNKMNGFFALAWYNSEEKRIILARDRFGEKPLLWSMQKDILYFSSEMESLLKYPLQRKLNDSALWYYFRLSYIPAPHTVLQNIYKLEPGAYIEYSNGIFKKEKWYLPKKNPFTGTQKEAEEILRHKLQQAVSKRLISDRPLGAFLSGGIDSCIVAGLASKEQKGLHTYSITFPDFPKYNEESAINNNARHLNTIHRNIEVSKADLDAAIDPVLMRLSEPFADSSCVPSWILSKATSAQWTVALSGDGADEVFGGYNKHRAFMRASVPSFSNLILKNTASLLRPFSANKKSTISKIYRYSKGLSLSPAQRYFEWACFGEDPENDLGIHFSNSIHHAALINEACPYLKNGLPEEITENDIHLVLPNDMLHKVDQMSMAHALEVRAPFLDHDVVEFARSLPVNMKFDLKTGKKILRSTFSDLLPIENARLPKRGFEVPLADWVSGSLQQRIREEWLSSSFLREQGLFDSNKMETLLKNPTNNATRIWMLIVFQQWYKRFMS